VSREELWQSNVKPKVGQRGVALRSDLRNVELIDALLTRLCSRQETAEVTESPLDP